MGGKSSSSSSNTTTTNNVNSDDDVTLGNGATLKRVGDLSGETINITDATPEVLKEAVGALERQNTKFLESVTGVFDTSLSKVSTGFDKALAGTQGLASEVAKEASLPGQNTLKWVMLGTVSAFALSAVFGGKK